MYLRHLLFLVLLPSITCCDCFGDVIFHTDINTSQDGIQTTNQFSVGDEFDVNFYLEITNSNTVSAFSTSIQFDHTVLSLQSVSVPTRPTGFDQITTDYDINQANLTGLFQRFDALNLDSNNDLSATTPQIIGTLRFRATSSGSDVQITPFFLNGIDGVLDGNLLPVRTGSTQGDGGVFLRGGSFSITGGSSVPEPSSLLLTTGAIVGWIARSRSKRRKACLNREK